MDTGAVIPSSSQLLGPMPQDKLTRLKKAAEGMEAQMFQQVLNEAKSGFSSDSSFAAQTFRGMMNETLCRSMAETGSLGMSELLVRQFQAQATLNSSAEEALTDEVLTHTPPLDAQPETQP